MSSTRTSGSSLVRLRARWEAAAKRRVCLTLHRLGLLKPLSFVQWLVTNRCNFRCAFCEASAGQAGPNELLTREAETLIDELARLRTRLLFSGGEPLVREDLPHLIRHAHARQLPVGLVSNAFLVPELWPQLQTVPWFLFFTSLDGPPAHHDAGRAPGSFDRVARSLDLFAHHGTPMRVINTVVHHDNLDLLPELHGHLAALPATRWHLTPMVSVGRNREGRYRLAADDLARMAHFVRDHDRPGGLRVDFGESHCYLGPLLGFEGGKPFFCGAGLTRCSIMPDGTVLGCHQAYDSRLAEGNVREQSLTRIWRDGFARFRPQALPAMCAGCAQVPTCAGGCWAELQVQGGCLKNLVDGSTEGG
jgi:radical SAM protein with 4Fe4S-binding SPASM domain